MPEIADTNSRPNQDDYFMELTKVVAKRSTCCRRQVGAVAVKDGHIIATGYNGTPSGLSHCTADTCIRRKLNIPSGERHELCRGVHAEQNVIIQAALHGVSLKGATLYCTNAPCSVCAKMLINAGIKAIIAQCGYADDLAKEMLKDAGIPLTNRVEQLYKNIIEENKDVFDRLANK